MAYLGKALTKAVTVRACVFFGLLLLLAGEVERNPGPKKGKEKAASGPQLFEITNSQCDVYTSLYVHVCGT